MRDLSCLFPGPRGPSSGTPSSSRRSPAEAGLCPRPLSSPPPPGGGGPWREHPLAETRARARAGGSDWLGRLGGAWESGESLGEAEQTPGAAGAQGADPAGRRPADRSLRIGTEPGPGGKGEAPGGERRVLAKGAEMDYFCPAPREQEPGIFSQKPGPPSSQDAVCSPEKKGSSTPHLLPGANSFRNGTSSWPQL
jgi:hypothetical protein